MLQASNREQEMHLMANGGLLADQQIAISNAIRNIKDLRNEAEDLRDNYKYQSKQIDDLQKKIGTANESIARMQENIKKHDQMLDEVVDVLGKHAEALAAHSHQIAVIEDVIVEHWHSFQDVYRILYKHSEEIEKIESRLGKVENMVYLHENLIHEIIGDVKDLQERVSALEEDAKRTKFEKKINCVRKMIDRETDPNSKKLEEFAEFILQIRSSDIDFDIDDIVSGARLIFESPR